MEVDKEQIENFKEHRRTLSKEYMNLQYEIDTELFTEINKKAVPEFHRSKVNKCLFDINR